MRGARRGGVAQPGSRARLGKAAPRRRGRGEFDGAAWLRNSLRTSVGELCGASLLCGVLYGHGARASVRQDREHEADDGGVDLCRGSTTRLRRPRRRRRRRSGATLAHGGVVALVLWRGGLERERGELVGVRTRRRRGLGGAPEMVESRTHQVASTVPCGCGGSRASRADPHNQVGGRGHVYCQRRDGRRGWHPFATQGKSAEGNESRCSIDGGRGAASAFTCPHPRPERARGRRQGQVWSANGSGAKHL